MTAEVVEAGVDTVSFAFRPEGRSLFGAVDGFSAKPFRRGAAGSLIAETRSRDGGRLMSFPSAAFLAVETRLGALLAGDERCHELAPATELAAGAELARAELWRHTGADPGEATEVRRFDLTAGLRFGAGPDGLAFLDTVAGLRPARMVSDVWRGVDGRAQTVYARTSGRGVVVSRIYDKGRESGDDAPGRHVRIENQNRPARSRRYAPEVLSTLDLKGSFGRTMKAYLQTEELVTAGPDGAVAELAARAIRGELTHAQAERLIGSVALLKYGGRAVYDRDGDALVNNNKRSSRRLKALRESGVVLSDELPPEAVVPVSALLRDAIERFSA